MSTRTTRAPLLAAAAAILVLAVACDGSGDGDGAVDPSGSPTSSGTGSTQTGDPSASASVEPATGPLLKEETVSVNAPDGFRRMKPLASFQSGAGDPANSSVISLVVTPGSPVTDTDELARIALKSHGPGIRQREDVVLDGVSFYRIAGPDGPFYYENYGADDGTVSVNVTFNLDSDVPPAERQEIVDSVLASYSWG